MIFLVLFIVIQWFYFSSFDLQAKIGTGNEKSNNNTAADSSAEDDSDDEEEQKQTHEEQKVSKLLE